MLFRSGDLLSNHKQKQTIRTVLKQPGVPLDVLKEIAGEKSVLFGALSRKEITDIDRKIFLGSLLRLNVEREENMNAVLAVLECPQLYCVEKLHA